MVQNLTIDSELSNSSMFTGSDMSMSDLNLLIDGTTADSSGGDHIYTGSETDGLLVGLAEGDDPGVHTGHKIYTDSKIGYGAGASATIKIKLLQGASTVIKDFFTPSYSSAGAFTVTTLSEAEAADITDYSDLRFEIGANGGDFGGGSGSLYCAYLEIPDAPATATVTPAFMLFVE